MCGSIQSATWKNCFDGLPVKFIEPDDHLRRPTITSSSALARWKVLRTILQFLEKTPLKIFGLSHFLVVERV